MRLAATRRQGCVGARPTTTRSRHSMSARVKTDVVLPLPCRLLARRSWLPSARELGLWTPQREGTGSGFTRKTTRATSLMTSTEIARESDTRGQGHHDERPKAYFQGREIKHAHLPRCKPARQGNDASLITGTKFPAMIARVTNKEGQENREAQATYLIATPRRMRSVRTARKDGCTAQLQAVLSACRKLILRSHSSIGEGIETGFSGCRSAVAPVRQHCRRAAMAKTRSARNGGIDHCRRRRPSRPQAAPLSQIG